MNKKILLSTTIASTMFVTSAVMPIARATTDKVSEYRFSNGWVNATTNSLAVELKTPEKMLTKADVKELVKAKYPDNTVESITSGETTIENDEDAVGTGSVIKLDSGKEMTVVLFGDVDGDGDIDLTDSTWILIQSDGQVDFPTGDAGMKAADVVEMSDTTSKKVNLTDSTKVLLYNDDKVEGNLVDAVKLPDNTMSGSLSITAGEAADAQDAEEPLEDNVKEVSYDQETKTITVKVDVEGLQDSEVEGREGKWYPIKLNSSIASATFSTSEDYQVEKRDNGDVIVWVKADKEQVKLTVSAEGETLDLTINLVKVHMPLALDAEAYKVENPTGNQKYVSASDDAVTTTKNSDAKQTLKTVIVKANANKMRAEEGKTAKLYTVVFKVSMPADQIKVVSVDKDGKVTDTYEVSEYVENAVTEETEDTTYKVAVKLDASKATTNLVFAAKEATDEQIKEASRVTVTLDNADSAVKLKNVYVAALSGSGNEQNGNQTKIKTSNGISSDKYLLGSQDQYKVILDQYTIKIKGDKYAMSEYALGTEAQDYAQQEEGTESKYYALVIDLGEKTENLDITGDVAITKLTAENHEKYYSDDSNSHDDYNTKILVWLDANTSKATIKAVQKSGDHSYQEEENGEELTFTINFVDVSKPNVKVAEQGKTENVRKAESEDLGENYKVNETAIASLKVNENDNNIVVETRRTALKKLVHAEKDATGELKDIETVWYGIIVKTTAYRETLKVTKDDVDVTVPEAEYAKYGEVADNEILIWVDASKASESFVITNMNDNTKNCTVTVTNKDVSENQLNTASPLGNLCTLGKYTEDSVKKFLGNENYTVFDKNQKCCYKPSSGEHSNDNRVQWLTEDLSNRKLRISLNTHAMEEYTAKINGNAKVGKWIALGIRLGDSTNITAISEASKEQGFTVNNIKEFGITTNNCLILWVNADDLKNAENNQKVYTLTLTDSVGLEETSVLTLTLVELGNDNFKLNSDKTEMGAFGNIQAVDENGKHNTEFDKKVDEVLGSGKQNEKAPLKNNMSAVYDVVTTEENGVQVVTIYVDANRLQSYQAKDNGNQDACWICAKIDLGVNHKLVDGYENQKHDKWCEDPETCTDIINWYAVPKKANSNTYENGEKIAEWGVEDCTYELKNEENDATESVQIIERIVQHSFTDEEWNLRSLGQ